MGIKKAKQAGLLLAQGAKKRKIKPVGFDERKQLPVAKKSTVGAIISALAKPFRKNDLAKYGPKNGAFTS